MSLRQFENYLEIYLRTFAPPNLKERYVVLLHQSLYGGLLDHTPSEEEIQRMSSGVSIRGLNPNIKAEERYALANQRLIIEH